MSFGKDKATIGAVGSFRQMGNRMTQKPVKKGRGSGSQFRDKYRPSFVAPDTVRLVAGDYTILVPDENNNVVEMKMPNFKSREHYYARNKRTCICSGGPLAEVKGQRDPCLGCDQFWAGWHTDAAGKKKRGPMGMSDTYIFNVLHYANYHQTEQTDGDGNVKMGTQGTPYMEWVACEATYGAPCKLCQSGAKTELGRMLHWSMGYGHYMTILGADEQIGRSCSSCGTRDSINWNAWLCQGPNCGEAVIDRETTNHSAEDIKKISTSQTKCPFCGHFGWLLEDISCSACPTPVRATLFDVDMNVMRIKQGRGENETTVLQCSQWSEPRPIDPRFLTIAKPFDLDKIYSPTPIDEQAKVFQLPLPTPGGQTQPQGAVTADTSARPYSNQGMYKP